MDGHAKGKGEVLDKETVDGIRKLREHLKNPVKCEKWANGTLDMSRMRKR